MAKQSYIVLAEYLKQIAADYGIHICINDFSGFVFLDEELTELLHPYMIHSNPYCMMVKSDKGLWDKCQEMKKPIAEKCRRLRSSFYGRCHGGVEEYILPIFSNVQLIGTVHAGIFSSSDKDSERTVKELARSAGLEEQQLLEVYLESVSGQVPEADKINSLLGIAAEYIGRIYNDFTITNPKLLSQIRFNSGEDNILGHTLDYIKRNYKEQVSVSEVAKFCHCSVSYINHTFKKRMNVNIREYINRLRVNTAKSYLTGTSLSIKEVASFVGFHDPNYFCKVFTEMCGIPPSAYRKGKE
ncbi:helix-turn-helix domain-containing protein [Anaerocolumna sp. AGMB13020]|uniref:helix-turn-helix domain-containing protein n=1 Tax=Anaerocolumna sp. AGMB13020 TaxID=3081750 RepID=UPI00295390FA|nr:helix-turn-helix domain-containing protein [Anaerocolumna sp. AGMB13020]WOO36673.1 helix-turn-helix domain-containing protein [Anaerocolumna sp. AGMB13020]